MLGRVSGTTVGIFGVFTTVGVCFGVFTTVDVCFGVFLLVFLISLLIGIFFFLLIVGANSLKIDTFSSCRK